MKIAAIVIIYNPDIELLKQNISAFINDVDIVIIHRNSPTDLSDIKDIWNDKILFAGDETNQFIASPLNKALHYCQNNGINYLLTMDQDSVWENFNEFLKSAQILFQTKRNIIISSPNINNTFDKSTPLIESESVITSGSLIDVNKALQIGGFKEKYKIYWVDGEFCFRSRLNNYLIITLPKFNLKQQFGRQTKTKFGYTTSNYSSTVYYYLIRNMLWEHREYGRKAVSLRCILYTLTYTVRGIILGENHKLNKIGKILKALRHGLTHSYK